MLSHGGCFIVCENPLLLVILILQSKEARRFYFYKIVVMYVSMKIFDIIIPVRSMDLSPNALHHACDNLQDTSTKVQELAFQRLKNLEEELLKSK